MPFDWRPSELSPSALDREIKIIGMGKVIKGMTGEHVMQMKICEIYGFQQGVTMGREAVRREMIRARIYAREASHVAV